MQLTCSTLSTLSSQTLHSRAAGTQTQLRWNSNPLTLLVTACDLAAYKYAVFLLFTPHWLHVIVSAERPESLLPEDASTAWYQRQHCRLILSQRFTALSAPFPIRTSAGVALSGRVVRVQTPHPQQRTASNASQNPPTGSWSTETPVQVPQTTRVTGRVPLWSSDSAYLDVHWMMVPCRVCVAWKAFSHSAARPVATYKSRGFVHC